MFDPKAWRDAHRESRNKAHREWAKANREKTNQYHRNWVAKNQVKDRQRVTDWRKNNPERLLDLDFKWRYNLSKIEYDAILKQQGGVCAICKQEETSKRFKRLSVDHDHATGKVRGLLCSFCNRVLGIFKDDPERFRAAAAYLRKKR